MMANGFGGNNNPSKAVWKQTVSVTTQTEYTFSCKVVNLAISLFGQSPNPAKLHVFINGLDVSGEYVIPTDNTWHSWPDIQHWNSGSATQAEIAIYDYFTGNSGLGDDFGLDQISFIPGVTYSATANDDSAGPVCLNSSIDINVLENDNIQPNANDAIVSVYTAPGHGTATVLPSKEIQYTFTDENYSGATDQFQYRVNNHGVTSEAWVTVSLIKTPSVGEITSPEGICAGESFDLTVPSIQDNGSSITDWGWEIAPMPTGEFTSLTNSNIPFNYNGYYLRYKAVNGCGSAYSNLVQVTVYSTEPTYDTIMACDAYLWNGINCDHTDDYNAPVTTQEGCEITAYLHFILNEDYYFESQTEASCDEYTWLKNGLTYYESGVYNDTVDNPNPIECDSIYTLYLTINHAPAIQGDINAPNEICVGDTLLVTPPPYAMNHADGGTWQWEYATAPDGPFLLLDPENNGLGVGDYFLRFKVSNTCDSDSSNVVAFRVNDTPIVQGTMPELEVCEGFPLDLPQPDVVWNNVNENDRFTQWQMSPNGENYAAFDPSMPMQAGHNGYWVRFMAHNTCGEDYLGPAIVSVLSVPDIWDTIPVCNTYTLPSGETISQSQMLEYPIAVPCPHTLYQYIQIHYSDTVVEPITSCHDVFEWHGETFMRSDETVIAYWDTLNIHGCDSVVELHLDFGDYAVITEHRAACESYLWPRNGMLYTESQTDSIFIPGSGSVCDSIIYLNLTIGHEVSVVGEPWIQCPGFEWNGVTYYDDDVVYETLTIPVTLCDSVISHALTIVQSRDSSFYRSNCKPIMWYGQYCGVEGDYTYVIPSEQGCDSIVLTMHFSFDEIQNAVDTTACEPFLWHGHLFDADGETWAYTYQTPEGCDSTVTLTFHRINSVVNTCFKSACDSYTINGEVYDQPGQYDIYLDTLMASNGCDSILHLRLTIRDSGNIGMIQGENSVYVATNLISGIYRYEIDPEVVLGSVIWNLSNPDWSIVGIERASCRVMVTTPGTAILKAHFLADCGEMERQIVIHAGFYDVAEYQSIEAHVFPNPTQGQVTVEAEGILSVRVIDMLGQTLENIAGDGSDRLTFDIHAYQPSVYLLEIKTLRGAAMERLVLCR